MSDSFSKEVDDIKPLLAPNGKPSNLTPKQYLLVRTQSFKAWFGDWEKLALTKINDSGIDEVSLKRLEDGVSKVVDENGEPLVVYHGTNNDFYTFDKSKIGLNHRESKSDVYGGGFFFTDKKNKAFRGNIKEVFLKIKKPLLDVIEDKYGYEVDYYHATDKFDLNSTIYFQKAKENRNNGIIVKTPRGSLFVAFDPKQIKLADGTNTTFDSKNPDIRFEEGGEISFNNNRVFFNGEDLGLFEYDINGNEIEINRLYLDTNKQKQGFGRKIIKNLFESYPNVNKIVLYPLPSSEPFWIRITENVRKDGYFEITRNSFEIGNKKYFRFKKGGRTIAQTPAPKKERIYGSEKNKPESSKDTKSAEKIEFNESTLETIKNKVAEHNEKNPKKKVTLASAKAVVRRGMGAYSSSHRPTITGGKPNSRVAWGLARLNKFLEKAWKGYTDNKSYIQDDDILAELGLIKKFETGGYMENNTNMIQVVLNEGNGIEINKLFTLWNNIKTEKDWENWAEKVRDFRVGTYGTYNILDVMERFDFDKSHINDVAKRNFKNEVKQALGGLEIKFEEGGEVQDEDFYESLKRRGASDLTIKLNQFLKENGGLIAPNGKPSNLTPEQYKLVRTKAFKDWFGDWENSPETASKVVDSNGEPLVVYHGSNNEFNVFSLEYTATNTGNSGFLGRGFYFSTNKTDAKNYGQIVKPYFLKSLKKLDLRNIEYKELAFLLPDLKMKNGKTWKESFIEIDNIKSQIKSIEIEDLKNGFFNVHYEYNGNWGMIPKRTIHEIETDKGLGLIIYRLIEEDPNNIGAIGNYFNPTILSQEIKKQGFDSVMSNGTNIYDLGDEIVVFEPNQIKLADGTNTTFDPNNPDIRYASGGNIDIHINKKQDKKMNEINNVDEVARAIQLRTGSAIKPETIREVGVSYYFEYLNSNTETSISKKYIDDTIWMRKKGFITYGGGGHVAQHNNGLIVVCSTQEDNEKFKEIIEKGDLYAEYNSIEGYWFLPEEPENYDSLEAEIFNLLEKYDINAHIEGVFNQEEEQVIEVEPKHISKSYTTTLKSNKGQIKINLDKKWLNHNVVLVPVSIISEYREFDRRKQPKLNQVESNNNIDYFKNSLIQKGITEPLTLEFNTKNNILSLTDGNHRLNAAIELEMDYFPIYLKITDSLMIPKGGKILKAIPNNSIDITPYSLGLNPKELTTRTIEYNETDYLKFDIPLFIRLLEWAREDAKTDMDLHYLVEKALQLKDKELSMSDYDFLVNIPKSNSETEVQKMAKGGLAYGRSHADGGIPLIVKSTGQAIEIEGGEGVVNKFSMSDDEKFDFEGKRLNTCEIISELNSRNNNGVKLNCEDIVGRFEK